MRMAPPGALRDPALTALTSITSPRFRYCVNGRCGGSSVKRPLPRPRAGIFRIAVGGLEAMAAALPLTMTEGPRRLSATVALGSLPDAKPGLA